MKINKPTIRNSEAGLALISLVFVMLILGVVGYTFVSIISTHRYGFTVTESSMKAFYIKAGAEQLGKKYIKDLADPMDYAALENFPLFIDEPMGDGIFSVWIDQTDIVAFRYSVIDGLGGVSYSE